MTPNEQLKEEHEAIRLMLRILEGVCTKLQAGEKVDPEHLDKILEFIKVFADKCHHGKEEDVLFPAMEETGIPKQGGPIGVMLAEHDTGRNYVRGMSEAVARYKTGDHEASSQLVENTKGYVALLRQHIEKEDNVLYPLGDARISEEKQQELLQGFENIEQERVGPGRHEEFHKLLHHLKEIYLN